MERTELEARIRRVSMLVWMMTGATLLAGITLAAMSLLAEDAPSGEPMAEQGLLALIIGITGAIALISVSMLMFGRTLARDADKELPVEERLRQYTSAYILRMALLEGGVLLNVILFFVYHQDINLLVAAAPYAIMFLQHPSADHFEQTFPGRRNGGHRPG